MSVFVGDEECSWTLADVGIVGESAVAERWPARQVGTDSSTPDWIDAVLQADLVVDGHLVAGEGTPIQTKLCGYRVRDGQSQRQGRWLVYRDSFEKLLEAEGLLALGVHDPELSDQNPIVIDVFYPEAIENLGLTWVDNGGREVARVRWGRVFRDELVDDTRNAMLTALGEMGDDS